MQVIKGVFQGCYCTVRYIEKVAVQGLLIYRVEDKAYLAIPGQVYVCPKCKYKIPLDF